MAAPSRIIAKIFRILKIPLHFLKVALHSPLSTVAFVAFVAVTAVFWFKPTEPHCEKQRKTERLLDILDRFPGELECASQFFVYHLHDNEHVYSLQVEQISDTRRKLSMCRVRDLHKDCELDPHQGHEDIASYLHEINSTKELKLIRELCDEFVYNTSGMGVGEEQEVDPTLMNAITHYQVLMEQGAVNGEDLEASKTDYMKAVTTLLTGIYPGTKWCGFDNIANDVYSDLGTEPEVDACCRRHDLCRPLVNSFQTRYSYYNPSILPASHCKCDLELYNCFRRTGSPVAAKVAHIFFNLVKMKCFDFGLRHFCSWKLLGVCLSWDKKCAAILHPNKGF